MDIEINVSVKVKKDESLYNMDLKIPTSGMDKDHPFKFVATVTTKKDGAAKVDDVLKVVYADKGNFLVAVAPPKSMLAGLEDYVDSLVVKVSEGSVSDKIEDVRIVELTELNSADSRQLPEPAID